MKNLVGNYLMVSVLLVCATFSRAAELKPDPVFYIAEGVARTAYVYKPEGSGPFPVMVYCQATPKPSPDLGEPKPFQPLANFFVSRGWGLFLPGRPTLTVTEDPEKKALTEEEKFMASIYAHNENIAAAIKAMKSQAFVDMERIFLCGHSTGGINTFLLSSKETGVRGCIVFSPGAKVWHDYEALRNALVKTIENAAVPIFLIQPQNDFDLGPVIFLGPALTKKGRPNRTKVFDPYGKSQAEGNSFAFAAPELWGEDVLRFTNDALAATKK